MLQRLSDNELADLIADCLSTSGCPQDTRQRLGYVLEELAARRKPSKFKRGDRVRVKGTDGPILIVVEQIDDGYRLTMVYHRGQQQSMFLPEEALELADHQVDSQL